MEYDGSDGVSKNHGQTNDWEGDLTDRVGESNSWEGESESGEGESVEGDGESDQYLEEFEDSDNEINKDEIDYLKNVDTSVEFGGFVEKNNVQESDNLEQVNDDMNINDDEEQSGEESDDNSKKIKWPVFNARVEMSNPVFCHGLTFASKAQFKEACKNYGLVNGKALRFTKNDRKRYIVECKEKNCPWYINLRKVKNAMSWRIYTMNDKHDSCTWARENPMLTSSVIAKKFKKDLTGSSWTMEGFREHLTAQNGLHITKKKAYRIMSIAKNSIEGEDCDSYNNLWHYIEELKKTNPNSSCFVRLSDLSGDGIKKRFLRLYMCWEAAKEGFKFCRNIIGVDGTHLKGKFGGQMLTAIGIDGNDSIFPLAYAIVEGETKDSWTWFLELLKRDLSISPVSEQYLTFISDKQKGLIPAFEDVFPAASHRLCVRHLHGNLKVAGFPGKAMKDALWAAAKATTMNSFESALKHIRELDPKAYEWLSDKHPSEWSKSHFSPLPISDMLVNNISECFNSMLVTARQKPLLICLDMVRKLLMVRFYENAKKGEQFKGPICPNIVKKLAVNEKNASVYSGFQSDEFLFEIKGMAYGVFEQHRVDLERWSCSCRSWDLTGIPCRHAIAAIWLKRGKKSVNEYVHPCYSVENYLRTYSGSIKPLAGIEEWPKSARDPPLPPLVKRKPGRPSNKRKKGLPEQVKEVTKETLTKDGLHVKRSLIPLHCKNCNKTGHNVRRCLEDPKNKEKLTNPKKKVRAKKSKQVPPQVPLQFPPPIPPTVPTPEESITQEDVSMSIEDLLGGSLEDFWKEAELVANSMQPLQSQQPVEIPVVTQPESLFGDDETPTAQNATQVNEVAAVKPVQGRFQVVQGGARVCYGAPPKRTSLGLKRSVMTTPKELSQQKRKTLVPPTKRYCTRKSLKSKFTNTIDKPVNID